MSMQRTMKAKFCWNCELYTLYAYSSTH